jgi:NAD(P)-dependent dehydrogenase (short-subunit alcohol dehydrogenase family)
MTTSELAGRVVAITGGARGIGRATAQAFSRAGAQVAIGDLDEALATATAAEFGGLGVALDVTDRASVEGFVATVQERLGPLDVFVNNAGIMPTGPFLEEPDDLAERQIHVNLYGVMYGMRAALPGMLARRDGHIVNVASGAGKIGFAGGVTYCATKHAVVGMTEAARAEYRRAGVSFHIVMPAIVRTDLTSGLRDGRGMRSVQPEQVAAAIVRAVATGRVDVFVPAEMGLMARLSPLLPRRVLDGMLRATGADRTLLDFDAAARHAYEARIGQPGSDEASSPDLERQGV